MTPTLQGQVQQVTQAVIGLTGIVGQLANGVSQLVEQHRQLSAGTEQRFAELVESQRRTDERLNILIEMFDRRLREDPGSRHS